MKSTAITAFLITLISSSAAVAVERPFDAPTLYHSDPNSMAIVVVDFNGDGILDIIQGQNYYEYIFFHVGNGDGSFQSLFPWHIYNYGEPDYLDVGDLNGDGLVDLVVLTPNITSVLRIYLSDSTINEVPQLSTTPNLHLWSEYVSYLALADENNDGHLDILMGGNYLGPWVMYNNGDGTFADRISLGIAAGLGIHTADLNHDDYPDFVSNYSLNVIEVTLSDGVGGYQPPDTIPSTGNVFNPLTLFDVTGDGELDVLYRVEDSTGAGIDIAVNLGAGEFDTAGRFVVLPPDHLVFSMADVFGDGFLDVVAVNPLDFTYAIFNHTGSLTFEAPVTYPADYRPGRMEGFDFNGDGFDDLLSIGWTAMGVYINRGDGTFPEADYFNVPSQAGFSMMSLKESASSDFNGDGYPDIAIFGQKGSGGLFNGHYFTIFYNDSTGHVGPSYDRVTLEWVQIWKSNNTDHLITGDFIGDAAADLVVCGRGYYKIYTGPLTSGGPALGDTIALGVPTSDNLVGIAADVDRDNDQDLVFGVRYDLVIKYNEGGVHAFDSTFASLTTAPFTALDTLDIDDDGDLDLVALAMPANRVFVLENDGDGNFSSKQELQLVPFQAGDLTDVEAADFNNDGYDDAAVLWDTAQDATTGMVQPAVFILMNDGAGNLAEAGSYHHIASAQKLVTEDFDGDGDYDLALNAAYPKGAAVLLNDGTGSFAATGLNYGALGPGGGIIQVNSDDFNLDGRPDIVLFQGANANAGTIGTLSFLFNNGDASGLCPDAGDVDQSGALVTSDIIYLVNFVLKGGPAPTPCMAAGDVDCSGTVVTSDIIYLVNTVLKGGAQPCDVCALIPGTWSCP